MALLVESTEGCELSSLEVGDQIGQRVTLTDLDGIPTDATVSSVLQRPDGSQVPATVIHEGVGLYLVQFPVFDQDGIWRWITRATGLIQQLEQGKFRVRPLLFT